MNNKEYIAELSRHTGFSQDDTQRMVRCVVEGMSQKFDEGIGISIASFGVFEIKKRMERIVVNPSSGQRMLVPPKVVVTFKAETSARKTASVPKGFVDISDFGRVLTERYGLNDNDAFSFVHFMFATVSEELLVHPDATVKIKGLGSFKTGRGKYSFSPEVMLRDRINRPFLQFETVILNDGVDFSEMDEEDFADSEDNDEFNDEVDNVAETEADMQEPMAEEEPADAEVESKKRIMGLLAYRLTIQVQRNNLLKQFCQRNNQLKQTRLRNSRQRAKWPMCIVNATWPKRLLVPNRQKNRPNVNAVARWQNSSCLRRPLTKKKSPRWFVARRIPD